MGPELLETVKNGLIAKRSNLIERLSKLDKDKKRSEGPLEADFEEQAIELQGNDVVDALDDLETEELGKINLALRSIDEGTYGTCGECGEPISEARLKALPYTRYCINCANDH